MAKHRKRNRLVLLVTGILAVVVVGAVVGYRDELVAWYEFRQLFEGLGRNEQGRPEYRHRETGIVFVGLPGGTFEMGSPDNEDDRDDREGPVHKVRLSPFLIAKYEVSQAEWQKVMGTNPSQFKGDTLPVENVSWEDCQEFCTKAGLSLPTEAQWEYACRAGTAGPFAGTGKLDNTGWYSGNSGGKTHPVGEMQPNQFGLHDMHGNVWEWCLDWYSEDFYSSAEASGLDPLCESGSVNRVFRGGSWFNDARLCRSAFRFFVHPSYRNLCNGFRPCRLSR